ncbi:MAG TPA: sigma-70 family RNA polymerase sigma factor [Flavisolibacter sp.]|nr:sigma-70 family RNA polymerase sigma factor [Flavisolibacter sp.]
MRNGQNNEIALWEDFVAGDKNAYAAIYRTYYPLLFNYGHNFITNTALIEDCIQEIFIQFWMNRTKLETVHSMRSYLFVSFRRALLKAADNGKQTGPLTEEETGFSFSLSLDQVMIDRETIYERNINLKSAVEKLTGRQKEAVFLMYYQNMSYEEISVVLQISKKATYKLMARAVSELRTFYRQAVGTLLLLLILLVSPFAVLTSGFLLF